MDNAPQILIVEDEGIVVLDIQRRLEDLGYQVVGHVSSGFKAIEKAKELLPDLILMDIKLQGEMDGIEAAHSIQELDIPIIYLTAFADNATLERAKVSEPFGYILKPFEQRDLHTTIQISLHKHQLTQKIKKSERWLSTTLNSIGEAVIATDTKCTIKFVNPEAESLTGWKSSQIIGEKICQLIKFHRISDNSEIPCPIELCIENEAHTVSEMAVYLTNRTGDQVPVDFTTAPNDDYGAVVVCRDISDRIKMEAALKENEELFRSLANLPPVGIFRTDEYGKCTFTNDHLGTLTGLSKKEIFDYGWTKSIHREDKAHIQAAWNKAIEDKQPFKEEHRLTHKNGEDVWVISEAHPIYFDGMAQKGYFGAIMDITKQKNAEKNLLIFTEELEERVDERTAELSMIINAMAGREVRMADLKNVIKKLRAQIEQAGMTPIADDPLNDEIV